MLQAGQEDLRYFEKRIAFCESFCRMFPEVDELYYPNMRRVIAESYSELGQCMEAEKAFEQLIADFTNNPWGYISFINMLPVDKKQVDPRMKSLYIRTLQLSEKHSYGIH